MLVLSSRKIFFLPMMKIDCFSLQLVPIASPTNARFFPITFSFMAILEETDCSYLASGVASSPKKFLLVTFLPFPPLFGVFG